MKSKRYNRNPSTMPSSDLETLKIRALIVNHNQINACRHDLKVRHGYGKLINTYLTECYMTCCVFLSLLNKVSGFKAYHTPPRWKLYSKLRRITIVSLVINILPEQDYTQILAEEYLAIQVKVVSVNSCNCTTLPGLVVKNEVHKGSAFRSESTPQACLFTVHYCYFSACSANGNDWV